MAQCHAARRRDMKTVSLSRRQRMLVQCAPLNEERVKGRAMRAALHRARKGELFVTQQSFDRSIGALVQAIPIPAGITEWFDTETLISPPRRTWQKQVRNPAILATGIAVVVIAAVSIFQVVERMRAFP